MPDHTLLRPVAYFAVGRRANSGLQGTVMTTILLRSLKAPGYKWAFYNFWGEHMKILDMSAGNRAVWFDKKNPFHFFVGR
jgi:hypothetical protein